MLFFGVQFLFFGDNNCVIGSGLINVYCALIDKRIHLRKGNRSRNFFQSEAILLHLL